MIFEPALTRATLLKRYKRFLADIRFEDGTEVTAHVANPGAMTGLAEEGSTVFLSHSDDPKRKLAWSWQIATDTSGASVCVNTGLTNRLVEDGLKAGAIPGLTGYDRVRREVKTGDSRLDFLLEKDGAPACYVEVKAVTLSRHTGLAEFPDAKTARGTKHLMELTKLASESHRAVMLYVAMRADCDRFTIARDIDLRYDEGLKDAREAGVEVLTACVAPSPTGLELVPGRTLDWTEPQ